MTVTDIPPSTTPPSTSAPTSVSGYIGRGDGARIRPRVLRNPWPIAKPTVDACMVALAAFGMYLGGEATVVASPHLAWTTGFAALVLVLLGLRGSYRLRLGLDLLEDLKVVVVATSLAGMSVLAAGEIATESAGLSSETIRVWALATTYLIAGRIALHWSQRQARCQGDTLRRTLVVGAGRVGRQAASRLLAHPELGLRPVGFLDKNPLEADGHVTLPVLGASWDLEQVVDAHRIEHVVIAFSTAPAKVLLRVVQRCSELGVTVSFVPRLFEKMTGRLTVEHIGGLPLLTADAPNPQGWQFGGKYALDRVFAALLLLALLPVFAAIAVAVLVSLGRPILFRQVRVGRDGRTFEMLKFRSMRPAERKDATTADFAPHTAPGGVEGADRRTRVGMLLRRSSADELPQLLNVLRGDMSLIGPRPERPEFVGMFERSVYRYNDRHRVKSGITGWAQVNGLRGKTSLADRVEWDNYYIENWSVWLDIKIMLMTAVAVIRASPQVE
jgi:exopolysaccharide biosynthesis polyprenyl glycosylphosphotransferase